MANRRIRGLVAVCIFFLAPLAVPALTAQPSLPPHVRSANNSADYSTTIAQGSLFVIFGENLGPAALTQVSSFPLPNVLAGTSVTVTSGSTTLNCPMIYTSSGQVAAVMPSSTPVGTVTIAVFYNGIPSPGGVSRATATVAANSVGIYTLTSSGVGGGSLTTLSGTLLTTANAAKPGDDVYLWGTGLGPIDTPDNVLPPSFPNFPNVQVWVGGQPANIVYAGRSGCCAGVDQLVFTVPAIANGCNVPITVVSGGSSSNTVTMPVSSSGGACSDTGPTLPTLSLSAASAGNQVKLAVIGVGPTVVASALSGSLARSLSAALHTEVSRGDAAALIRAYASHNPKNVRRAMRKYAAGWKALDSRTKARLSSQMTQLQNGAVAQFGSLSSEATAAALGAAQLPSAGSCVVFPNMFPSTGAIIGSYDAGPSLALSTPAGAYTLKEYGKGSYSGSIASLSGQNTALGSYTIAGSGGTDIGAFSATITVASHPTISNASSLATIDRSQPLIVTWTGGVAGNYVLIAGEASGFYTTDAYVPPSYFACAEDGGKGTFTIPSYILSSMNPTGTGKGGLLLSPHPLSHQITIPGIDLAYFIDGSSSTVGVTFK